MPLGRALFNILTEKQLEDRRRNAESEDRTRGKHLRKELTGHRDEATIGTSWQSHWLIWPHQRWHWASVWQRGVCKHRTNHRDNYFRPATSNYFWNARNCWRGTRKQAAEWWAFAVQLLKFHNYSCCKCPCKPTWRSQSVRVWTTQLIRIVSAHRQRSREVDRCCKNIPCFVKKLPLLFLLLLPWQALAFIQGLTYCCVEEGVCGCRLLFHTCHCQPIGSLLEQLVWHRSL